MPVLHRNVRYNCRILFLNREILLIRPKMFLANDGNYRETRWFSPYMQDRQYEDYFLPATISEITGQQSVPFGNVVLATQDAVFGTELCEELFIPNSPHVAMSLDGVEIFTNGSGSHHEFKKLHTRIDLIREATVKCGGVYLYANQQGCDGERVYYDGSALVVKNGDIVAQGSQFSVSDVEVVSATIDIEEIRTYRSKITSRNLQPDKIGFRRICTDFRCSRDLFKCYKTLSPSKAREPVYLSPEEEIRYGPACWLWDYLRRSKAAGFYLPLSGGIDSCATALLVYSMATLVVDAAMKGDKQVIADAQRVSGAEDDSYIPTDAAEFCGRFFHTCFLGMSENSSAETRSRAKRLAENLGSYHLDTNIDLAVTAVFELFVTMTGKTPRYKVFGGSETENLALQNIQARIRMVMSYMYAQLLPWTRGRSSGSLLVLGSANVDETLRGYFTKYDCSSADINPIGGISKTDLRKFIMHAKEAFGLPLLSEFLDAPPTAELEPITKDHIQEDEVDMGFTYSELSVLGTLRKVANLGPFGMFSRLLTEWNSKSASEVASTVKKFVTCNFLCSRFFFFYSINRHKTTILPPSYHMSQYSPDDNRFDLRPFLYNSSWNWQFGKIDDTVKEIDLKNGGA
ncbi:MAG: hypothetical protein SGCHY_003814 [Lobulomycetales sp.]